MLIAKSYLHGLDPFAIQFTETFGLRWYGLSYAAGFVIAWWMLRWLAKRGKTPLSVAAIGDFMFYIIAGVLVGGRVGYALFYQPTLFIGFSPQVPFWDLLALGRGGMASHGGVIGVIVACLIFARRHDCSKLHVLDLVAFICPPGLGLGRLANFVNGELHGKALPDQVDPPWWSMKFPQELLEWPMTRLAEITSVVVGPLGLTVQEWQTFVTAAAGGDECARETVHGYLRHLVTLSQEDSSIRETLRPVLTAFHPSQLIQSAIEGPVLLLVLTLVWLVPRRPGVIGSWFLFAYGVLRIATEVFREPDQGVALLMGLSRGQVLSVLMMVAGAVALVITSRRNVEPMGGLR